MILTNERGVTKRVVVEGEAISDSLRNAIEFFTSQSHEMTKRELLDFSFPIF